MLVSKVVNGTKTNFLLEGNDIIGEVTDGNTKVYMYDNSYSVVGFLYEGVPYYYVKNGQNDVIGIVDQNFEMVCKYQYDSWGNVVAITGNEEIARENPFRYRSYYYDSDMQMYHLKTRFYDSQVGRFLNMDKKEAAICEQENLNLYAYCNNNPVGNYDPLGLAKKICIMSLINDDGREESYDIGSEYKDYYDGNCSVTYYFDDNVDSYMDQWNQLSNVDIVIINTHGSPKRLSSITGNDSEIHITDVNELYYKSIDILILLGCNTGHWNYYNTCIAYAFASKVSGCVIACDGNVRLWFVESPLLLIEFRAEKGEQFVTQCGGTSREMYGWFVFVDNGNTYRYKLGGLNIKLKFTIESLFDYLDDLSYIYK